MTTLARQLHTQIVGAAGVDPALARRLLAVGAMAGAIALVPDGIEHAGHAIADAYLAVSVFVAATLIVIAGAQRAMRGDLGQWLDAHRAWQVPAGALLGALPGCGGAIVAVTQFTRGSLTFGGVVATLTSTMGDAMFLLLASEPSTAGLVAAVGIIAGVISGYLVDAIHGPRFLQTAQSVALNLTRRAWFGPRMPISEQAWWVVLAPGVVLAIAGALQIETNPALTITVGLGGGLLALGMWVVRGDEARDCQDGACALHSESRGIIDSVNFISAWVIFAFVGYELLMNATGWDIGSALSGWGLALPAAAIIAGFIPGCGPQIVVTSLYLDGAMPLSAQLGNAISNDGDALFPAIARAPGAAALATVYTTLPAVMVAYGAYALGW